VSEPILDDIRSAIYAALADANANVDVSGGGGHYSISVQSKAFAGKNMVESHRLVYAAIAHLMKGDAAPLHAVDSLKTAAR
jgi:stress-induced morphogen